MYFEIVKIVRSDFSEYQATVWNAKNKMQLITKPHFKYEPVGHCWKTENEIKANLTSFVQNLYYKCTTNDRFSKLCFQYYGLPLVHGLESRLLTSGYGFLDKIFEISFRF